MWVTLCIFSRRILQYLNNTDRIGGSTVYRLHAAMGVLKYTHLWSWVCYNQVLVMKKSISLLNITETQPEGIKPCKQFKPVPVEKSSD